MDEAIKTYSNLFNVGEKAARPFFQNQFVMTTLGLNMQSSSQVSEVSPSRQNESNKLNANFWNNVAEGVAKNEAKSDETAQTLVAQNLFLLSDFAASSVVVDFVQIVKLARV